MKIIYEKGKTRYFDMNGEEIHDGDTVMLDGNVEKVYLTENDTLGIDATNQAWIDRGWAVPCEYGIYDFNKYDEPVLIKKKGE